MHHEQHPQAGETVVLQSKTQALDGAEYRIEDWWDRVTGGSWMFANGNPAALAYAMRSGFTGLPTDDEVVYGKANGYGHLVHVSEISEPLDRVDSDPAAHQSGDEAVALAESEAIRP